MNGNLIGANKPSMDVAFLFYTDMQDEGEGLFVETFSYCDVSWKR